MIKFYLLGKQFELDYERLPRENIGFYMTINHYHRHIITLKVYLGTISRHFAPQGKGSAISLTILEA